MNEQNTSKRPRIISVICILAALFVLVTLIALVASSEARAMILQGPLSIVTVVSAVLALAGLVGYWKMRKWGVYAYVLSVVISIGYLIATGSFTVAGLIAPAIVIIIGVTYFKRMT